MNTIINQSVLLNQMIRESDEYKEYVSALQRLKENKELYASVNEFRRKNYRLQEVTTERVNRFDEVVSLTGEYKDVLSHSTVHEFFLAEQRFTRMMQEIYVTLSASLELDDDYMEK